MRMVVLQWQLLYVADEHWLHGKRATRAAAADAAVGHVIVVGLGHHFRPPSPLVQDLETYEHCD